MRICSYCDRKFMRNSGELCPRCWCQLAGKTKPDPFTYAAIITSCSSFSFIPGATKRINRCAVYARRACSKLQRKVVKKLNAAMSQV